MAHTGVNICESFQDSSFNFTTTSERKQSQYLLHTGIPSSSYIDYDLLELENPLHAMR